MVNKQKLILSEEQAREIFHPSPTYDDLKLLRDNLETLLQKEQNAGLTMDYMAGIQYGSLDPPMRNMLAEWMQEVLEEHCTECDETFSFSLHLLDMTLSRITIDSSSLQLVGGACLLISSKLKERCPLTLQGLAENAGFAFAAADLKVN
jgi:hypothetical protein